MHYDLNPEQLMPAEHHIPPQYMNLNLRDVIVTFCPSVSHSQVVCTQKSIFRLLLS